jgi:hypothetical protein
VGMTCPCDDAAQQALREAAPERGCGYPHAGDPLR